MRIRYSAIFLILIAALIACLIRAKRSGKPIRHAVGLLEAALIPPIVGNLLIVYFSNRTVALIGHYIYYLGMDLVIFALVSFTNTYCKGIGKGKKHHKPTAMYSFIAFDAVQMLLNPFFGHAFTIEAVNVDGAPYYKVVPLLGQTVHRIIDYFIFVCVILIYILAVVNTVKIYREKYTIILFSMATIGLLQTYFIFSQSPIDRSMIGYGIFGIIIYFFSIKYRPLRLLDRMLSNIVSDLSDAFYIFDPNGSCIWANEQGLKLVNETDASYENVSSKLKDMFDDGQRSEHGTHAVLKRSMRRGDDILYFELEENQVVDERGSLTGSYLKIHDVTAEERALQIRDEQIGQISKEAYKDALTGVGNKASYNIVVKKLNEEIAEGFTAFAVVMVDMNDLKRINDEYGHKAGDLYIRGCCHMICESFKHSSVFRIGGDEFVVLVRGEDFPKRNTSVDELRTAFKNSFEKTDAEPWEKYSASVGIAEYAADDNSYELVFKRADSSMYEEKKAYKEKCGSYR